MHPPAVSAPLELQLKEGKPMSEQEIRSAALNAALRLADMNGEPFDASELVDMARAIEAYLKGEPAPAKVPAEVVSGNAMEVAA
jgi:hypothetical protein